jgi:GTP pyrophosphokinase
LDLDAGRAAVIGSGAPDRSLFARRVRDLMVRAGRRTLPATLSPAARAAADPVTTLLRTHRAIHAGGDTVLLRRGYATAERWHSGQFRKSGEPYITHPLAVAQILAELGMDTTTLVAALLHDTVEDTDYTLPALREEFGPQVAHLVNGVTKFDKVYFGAQAEEETIRKMIVAAGTDVRVLIIKIADRLHNMRTLDARSPASRTRIARATGDVLVPLCDRLGIQALKRDLDDAVLRHLEPEAHARIVAAIADRPQWWDYVNTVVEQTTALLRRARIDATVKPRPRHPPSIWRDMTAGRYPEPFHLPRVVVCVDGPASECYAALGAIHAAWRPMAARFKDFIGAPKSNLYRSLHTTVIGPEERTVEVLIRTEEMDRTAEYGIAVNYRFPSSRDGRVEESVWLRRLLRWSQDAPDARQFVESLRHDLADAEIQVIAGGRVLTMPAGSIPVDVAYELGAETGDRCRVATVNSRVMPVTTPLSDGDVVEIFTAPAGDPAAPREEWLRMVRSPAARAHLLQWFGPADDEAPPDLAGRVKLGRAALGGQLRRHDRTLPQEGPLRAVCEQLGLPDPDALFVALAEERVGAADVAGRLIALVDEPLRGPGGSGRAGGAGGGVP